MQNAVRSEKVSKKVRNLKQNWRSCFSVMLVNKTDDFHIVLVVRTPCIFRRPRAVSWESLKKRILKNTKVLQYFLNKSPRRLTPSDDALLEPDRLAASQPASQPAQTASQPGKLLLGRRRGTRGRPRLGWAGDDFSPFCPVPFRRTKTLSKWLPGASFGAILWSPPQWQGVNRSQHGVNR